MALLTALLALGLSRLLPRSAGRTPTPMPTPTPGAAKPRSLWLHSLRGTLRASAPWLVALCFATYSSQWLAVVGFLPSIVQGAGYSAAATGVLTALVAASNIVGNIAAGRLLQRGVPPWRLLRTGFVAMGLGAGLAFAVVPDSAGTGPSPGMGLGLGGLGPYGLLLLFSGAGGLIPATLFALAVRAAPNGQAVAGTVGWMQQWSSFGQFAGPPLVAAVASAAGGWHFTGLATGALCAAGLLLTALLSRSPALQAPAAGSPKAPGGR